MKRLAIFDLDGTLINTIDDLAASVNYALSQLGFPTHNSSTLKSFIGNGVTKLIERALPDGHKDADSVQSALAIFRSYYDVHCIDFSRPYPGISKLLLQLQSSGLILAVASNKYQLATSKVISTLLPHISFTAVLGNSPDIPRKPDPTIVYRVIDICGVSDKSAILYIGDSGTDMQTAINAGVDSCAVSWGFRPLSELRTFSPSFVASSPEDIISFL